MHDPYVNPGNEVKVQRRKLKKKVCKIPPPRNSITKIRTLFVIVLCIYSKFYFRDILVNGGEHGRGGRGAGRELRQARRQLVYFRWMGCQERGAPEARGEEALPGCEHYRD